MSKEALSLAIGLILGAVGFIIKGCFDVHIKRIGKEVDDRKEAREDFEDVREERDKAKADVLIWIERCEKREAETVHWREQYYAVLQAKVSNAPIVIGNTNERQRHIEEFKAFEDASPKTLPPGEEMTVTDFE